MYILSRLPSQCLRLAKSRYGARGIAPAGAIFALRNDSNLIDQLCYIQMQIGLHFRGLPEHRRGVIVSPIQRAPTCLLQIALMNAVLSERSSIQFRREIPLPLTPSGVSASEPHNDRPETLCGEDDRLWREIARDHTQLPIVRCESNRLGGLQGIQIGSDLLTRLHF